jgi:hypothetical protein
MKIYLSLYYDSKSGLGNYVYELVLLSNPERFKTQNKFLSSPVASSCENDNKPSGFLKGREFLGYLNDC